MLNGVFYIDLFLVDIFHSKFAFVLKILIGIKCMSSFGVDDFLIV